MNRLAILAAALAAALLALPQGAAAHARLKRAEPRAGSTVATSPTVLKLWFSEAVEPAFSTIEVLGPDGRKVATAKAHLDPADGTLLETPLPRLAPGRYKVLWHALSVDTHRTQGSFAFTVAP